MSKYFVKRTLLIPIILIVSVLSVACASELPVQEDVEEPVDGEQEKISASGDKYTGEFKDGIYDGKGKMEYSDGSVYDGEWKAGEWEGPGKYESSYGATKASSKPA